jgi:MoaA/NifB/PqqE/SkfB family radical SAM enzyme
VVLQDSAVKRALLGTALEVFFKDALLTALTRPRQAAFFLGIVLRQAKASRTRLAWEARGVQVPAILIYSITTRCNLACKNCYAQALHPPSEREMDAATIRRVVGEAERLGVSFFVVAGGEPFLRPELLDIAGEFGKMLFLVFTNGLLIDDGVVEKLARLKNVVPLVSLEGQADDTDFRRGSGVHENLERVIGALRKRRVFFGTSLTVTRPTFSTLTDPALIGGLMEKGCKFFLFVEYTPVQEGTVDLVLTREQREELMRIVDGYHSRRRALFVTVPGAEESLGGCLAAGRGFVHLTAEGEIEPCPFVPYSDSNVREMPLAEALRSDLLAKLRAHPERLAVSQGGCCLWRQREWVESLMKR